MTIVDGNNDQLEEAAQREADRQRLAEENPEPSLGARLGQIGMLGWTIVIPALFGLWVGQRLDQQFETGVMFSGSLLMVGIAAGFWFAWRWMHKS